MSKLELRDAEPADIPDMHRLLADLAEFVGESHAYRGKAESLARYGFGDHKVFHSLLAFSGDEAVGLVNYFPEYSSWRGEPGVYVLDLFVCELQRGSGLGRRMIGETLTRAVQHWEAGYVRLSVHGHNAKAIHFYRSLGFREATDDCLMIAPANPQITTCHPSSI